MFYTSDEMKEIVKTEDLYIPQFIGVQGIKFVPEIHKVLYEIDGDIKYKYLPSIGKYYKFGASFKSKRVKCSQNLFKVQ